MLGSVLNFINLLVSDPATQNAAGIAGAIGLAVISPTLGLLEWM